MHSIRSILWIGPAEGLTSSGVLECPTLDVTWAATTNEALAMPPSSFDAEIVAPAREGLGEDGSIADTVSRLRRGPRSAPILVRLSASADEAPASLLAAGAADVQLADPSAGNCGTHDLLERIDRLADEHPQNTTPAGSGTSEISAEPETSHSLPGVIGESRAIREVLALVARARESTATVLVAGETGTGKEAIARGLHETGPRAGKPFVAVNCAAFPDSLLEAELFGHVRGAFTGADRDKPGLFCQADGGTLFLDEIGETSAPLQATLLRVLQEREVRPVGGARSRRVDVRVVAATNRSLREEASNGFFREDLYYRLAVLPITLPPLRDRREDILPLAAHFLALHGKREHKRDCRLSRSAAHLLLAYDWPGNVRELENEMHRAVALAEHPGAVVTPKLLSDWVSTIVEPVRENVRAGDTLRANMDRIEAWLIRRALERHGGRRTTTAQKLGVTREGLYKKMKRLGIE